MIEVVVFETSAHPPLPSTMKHTNTKESYMLSIVITFQLRVDYRGHDSVHSNMAAASFVDQYALQQYAKLCPHAAHRPNMKLSLRRSRQVFGTILCLSVCGSLPCERKVLFLKALFLPSSLHRTVEPVSRSHQSHNRAGAPPHFQIKQNRLGQIKTEANPTGTRSKPACRFICCMSRVRGSQQD